jgi:hypothetical protein
MYPLLFRESSYELLAEEEDDGTVAVTANLKPVQAGVSTSSFVFISALFSDRTLCVI